jgi:hypothetical protein
MRKIGILVIAAMALLALTGGQTYAQATNPTNSVQVTLTEQNGSGQNGVAMLTEQDGRLMVTIDISGGTEAPQPAHIHRGTCANLDPAPAYPLSNVINGKSETTLEVGMAALQGGQFAINVHKSAAEANVYVACGDIVNMQMGGGTGAGEQGGGEIIPPPEGTPEELAATSSPGMPRTGNGTQPFYLALLALVALTLSGFGLRIAARRR